MNFGIGIIILLIIVILYVCKSNFAGPMTNEYETRESYTAQPRLYRVPGYVQNYDHTIRPVTDEEEAAGVAIVSTAPYDQQFINMDLNIRLSPNCHCMRDGQLCSWCQTKTKCRCYKNDQGQCDYCSQQSSSNPFDSANLAEWGPETRIRNSNNKRRLTTLNL